jgi:hypothetical protein
MFRRLLKWDGPDFIAELYRELLNREADPPGFQHHAFQLARGTPKTTLMAEILKSKEAERLYTRPGPWPPDPLKPTAAGLLHRLFATDGKSFVSGLYAELLCREPDPAGLHSHLKALQRGASKTALLLAILQSEECLSLLHAPSGNIIAERLLKHILEQHGVVAPR